jgi:protoporphyrinogen oxidase
MPIQGKGAKDDVALGTKKEYARGGPDPETTDTVLLVRNRVSRIFYRRKFFDYPISLSARTFLNMGFGDSLLAAMSFIFSSMKKRGENSLEDFYVNRFGKKLYSLFFEDYTEKVWGLHPSKLSALWGAQRVKGLSVTAIIKEALAKLFNPGHKTRQTSLLEQFYYPKLGPGQLWSIVADKITEAGGRVHYDQRVSGIIVEDRRITGIKIQGGHEKITCDALLSSMPVKDLVRAVNAGGGETAPGHVTEIALELPYRDFITAGLLLKRLKLKNTTKIKTLQNMIPDCWIYIQEPDVRIGRLQIFNNWSPYMVKNHVDTVWMGLEYFCNEGDDLWNLSRDDFIDLAVGELVKIGIIDKKDVLDATQVKIEKAYPAYFGSHGLFAAVRHYLDAIDNLYCLGRNGQHKYNNMDHSMLTAMEAVEIIKSGGGDKSAVWNVNAEDDYHEEK